MISGALNDDLEPMVALEISNGDILIEEDRAA